jgi:hypothetical protein
MHVAPPAIRIVVVPTGVTVLLGRHNPPRSWTSTVDPSLPGFFYGLNTLEYSVVKATIGICTLADYSMAKKCQQPQHELPLQ